MAALATTRDPFSAETPDPLPGVAEAVSVLSAVSDPEMACVLAASIAAEALHAREAFVVRVDPRSESLVLADGTAGDLPFVAEPNGPIDHALETEIPVFDAFPDASELPWTDAPERLAVVPILARGTLRGALVVGFGDRGILDAGERAALQVIADAAALALDGAAAAVQTAAERERSQRLEGRMLEDRDACVHLMSVLAHEIRNPLSAVKGYVELMIERLADSETPNDRYLGIVNKECDRLSRLVADVLDLSRLESGSRPLRLDRIDLRALVEQTMDALHPLAEGRGIEFEIAIEPALVVEADEDLVRRLFINLVTNAIKFSPERGPIHVEAHARGDEWIGFVRDHGPGIPPEDLNRVFDRFYRSQEGLADVEGHGLGLAIARGIVEAHGGRIWAESRNPIGTRMCLALPLRQLAPPRARTIARRVGGRADVRGLLEETVAKVAESMDAEAVSVMLVDAEKGDLVIATAHGDDGEGLIGRRATFRSGLAGSVAASGRPILVNDIETDRRFARSNFPRYRSKSLMCVPVRVEGEVLGVLNVTNPISGAPFDEPDLARLSGLVDRLGHALERTWAHPENERLFEQAAEQVRHHPLAPRAVRAGVRAARIARALARDLGLPEADGERIAAACKLARPGEPRAARPSSASAPAAHGSVMDRLGSAMDRLGPAGDRIGFAGDANGSRFERLVSPQFLVSLRDLLLARTERWDGSGRPHGLAGEAIPLPARVLAVIDAYDGLRSGSAARAPLGRDAAGAALWRRAGADLDPRVVEAMSRVLETPGGEW